MLGDVAEINPRLRSVLEADDVVSFLGMADVSENGTTSRGTDRTYGEVRKGFTPFEAGDILLAKITPCFQNGKIVQAEIDHPAGFGSTEFHVIRSRDGRFDHRYGLHLLRLAHVRSDGERRMTGSGGQRRVPVDFLKALEIPLPPLPEQLRIAAILDHTDALRAKRREALTHLDELNQSIFVDMFAGVARSNQSVKLNDVASISSGITKGRKLNGANVRPVPYLAVANVQEKSLELTVVKTINATDAEIDRLRLRRNDLLLTEGGDPDKLGRGSLWREELPEAIHQNHIFRVRPDVEQVNPIYLNWAVGSRESKAYFLRSAKQTTGIASINMSQLKALPLDLPPLELQENFAERVERLEEVRGQHRTALAELDSLFASLQSRAFRGEL